MKLPDMIRAIERGLILDALRLHGWNQSHAARSLGLPIPTLNYKIARHGIPIPGRVGRPRRLPAEEVAKQLSF